MLTALEKGVKGGKWFSLIDKVYSRRCLQAAFARVKRNKGAAGVDHQSIEMFEADLEKNLTWLNEQLKAGSYRPQAIRRKYIPKPGRRKEWRPLGIPTIRDRVVQTAISFAIGPIFERDFAECSYGFRPGRGCKDALRQVEQLLQAGYTWVVDADIQGYFDNIPHQLLMDQIKEKIADSRLLLLIEAYLNQRVMEECKSWEPESGTPQGAIISPLLSNIYLNPLDHLLAEKGYAMVRYADDFVVLCPDENAARTALAVTQQWMTARGLTLHPEKTRLVDATQKGGFDFLGYHFERRMKWPGKKSIKKLRDTLRPKTKRSNGHSTEFIITEINKTTRGWFEYFKHSKANTFPYVDGWIRMRLRSILRKRNNRKGRGRGKDHHCWPNAYFAKLGLFSMTTARDNLALSVRSAVNH